MREPSQGNQRALRRGCCPIMGYYMELVGSRHGQLHRLERETAGELCCIQRG